MSVYFIEAPALGYVKIGTARNVAHRLIELQCGCPAPLALIGEFDGGRLVERRVHRALAMHRHRGEWFDRIAVKNFLNSAKSIGLDKALTDLERESADRRKAAKKLGASVRAMLVDLVGNGRHLPESHTTFSRLFSELEKLNQVLACYGFKAVPADHRDHNETLAIAALLRPHLAALSAIVRQADELRGAA